MMTDIASAATVAIQNTAIKTPTATADATRANKAAKEFEGVFISTMLGQMFEGISTDGPFGGGQGEAMFRSLMIDEYGKQIATQGGIGLANSVARQLLQHQEVAQ
jgi:peptidoglycan hydrolase FlgJ